MDQKAKAIIILYADDDPEDRMLVKDALQESRWPTICISLKMARI